MNEYPLPEIERNYLKKIAGCRFELQLLLTDHQVGFLYREVDRIVTEIINLSLDVGRNQTHEK